MSEKADPLMSLVVDTRQVNREQLAEILKGKVMLDLQSETFLLQPEVRAQGTVRQAVLLSLLARKALSLLKESIVDALTPRDITMFTGLKGNTIRTILRRLLQQGLVVKRPEGYTIHSSSLMRVQSDLHGRE
jgi:hypothetical protein